MGDRMFSRFFGAVAVVYLLGFMVHAAKYNYEYARSHTFVEWLFLGEVAPTLSAMVWPVHFLTESPPTFDGRRDGRAPSTDRRTATAAQPTMPGPAVAGPAPAQLRNRCERARDEILADYRTFVTGAFPHFTGTQVERAVKAMELSMAGEAEARDLVANAIADKTVNFWKTILAKVHAKDPKDIEDVEAAIREIEQIRQSHLTINREHDRLTVAEYKAKIESLGKAVESGGLGDATIFRMLAGSISMPAETCMRDLSESTMKQSFLAIVRSLAEKGQSVDQVLAHTEAAIPVEMQAKRDKLKQIVGGAAEATR